MSWSKGAAPKPRRGNAPTTGSSTVRESAADGDRCDAVYVQYTGAGSKEPGMRYSHRCSLPSGHDGHHEAVKAHRKWAQGVTERRCSSDARAAS